MKFKNYLIGVVSEGKRVRWPKGAQFREDIAVVLGYTIFFALFLMMTDALVIRILQLIEFK